MFDELQELKKNKYLKFDLFFTNLSIQLGAQLTFSLSDEQFLMWFNIMYKIIHKFNNITLYN